MEVAVLAGWLTRCSIVILVLGGEDRNVVPGRRYAKPVIVVAGVAPQ